MELLNKPNIFIVFLKLVRWPNLLILTLLQSFSGFFLRANVEIQSIFWQEFICIIISTILIAAGGNIINDIQDVEIDKINKPAKQIVEKYVSRKKAIILYGLLTFTGLLTSAFVGFGYFIYCLIAAQLLWLYATVLKCRSLIGNIAIALLMGLAVWVVQFADIIFNTYLIYFYTLFAALTGFIRELVKDIEDKEGDKQCGCNTFAVSADLKTVKKLIHILLLAGMLSLLAFGIYLWHVNLKLLSLYLILIIGTAFILYSLHLSKAGERKQFSRLSLYIKLIMLAGVLSMPLAEISF